MSRAARLVLWAVLLALAGALVATRLEVTGDLRVFMPAPRDDDQRLLLDMLGNGPGARLLLLAIGGGDPDTLADASRALRDALADADGIRRIGNGEDDLSAFPDRLLPYRYLLSDRFDRQPLDRNTLRHALQQRLADLGSPAAALVEPWIARDPTLELLALAERWQPTGEAERWDGLWFDRAHEHALLLVETEAGGFDPAAQAAAVAAIRRAAADTFAELDAPGLQLELSGPGAFSVLLSRNTAAEASTLGTVAGVAILLLLIVGYRSLRLPLLAALPVVSAALAALAAVSLLFGRVHGITLAFGFTLLGLAQDYPVHLLSHLHPGRDPRAEIRALWPTLAAGVGSTCLAYLAFLAAGVAGLSQLAVFTITGLVVAAVCTRWLLPALLPARLGDVAGQRWLVRLHGLIGALPHARWPLLLLLLALLPLLLWPKQGWWDDNLGHLTPVPEALLQRDRELRSALGAPDVRWLLVLRAPTAAGDPEQALLERSEQLAEPLAGLVADGVVDAVELPSQYLPSERRQAARQAALPMPDVLATMLEQAAADLPFKRGLFAPFLADVAAARQAPPLDRKALAETPIGSRLESLLPPRQPIALVALSGVHDPERLAAFADVAGADLHLLDLKAASEALAAGYRDRVLAALAGALGLLVVAMALLLRAAGRVLRVVAPVLAGVVAVLALLHGFGVALTLFHLVALILTVGLGLDYALFFEHAGRDPASRRRTLHAIWLAMLSTALVFGLLATSSIPVLQAIGLTVTLGVLAQFLFAAGWSQPPETR